MKPAQLFALLRLLCLAALLAGALPAHAQSTCQARAFNGHEEQVSAAYIAYYGRPADTGGLAYWAGKLAAEGGRLDAIIDAFGNSTEYRQRFGGLSNRELIRNLYQQLYGRDPDAGGWAFYEMWLDTKVLSLASIAISIMDGTEGDDVAILNNRKSVARHFITRMESLGAAAPQITDGDLLANLMAAIDASAASRENACAQVNALIDAQASAIPSLTMSAHEAGASGAISNLSGAVGSSRYFKLTVPAGVTNLEIRTFGAAGSTGDVDLHVSRGVRPVPDAADCSSATWYSAKEQCSFAAPVAGEYFILLRGYFIDYSGVTLSASWRGSTRPPEVEVLTGYLYDSAVAGVQYRSCSGNTTAKCIEGLTGLSGEFKYTQGQQVEFLIGGLRIGVAQGQELVTPDKLANGDAGVALQIAQLLQSLDADQDPSNGIVIPESVRSLAVGAYPGGQDVRFVNNSQVLSKLAPGRALVSMEQVSAHAQGSRLMDAMIANKSEDIPRAILGSYAYPTTGTINYQQLNSSAHARLRLALFYRKMREVDGLLRGESDFFEKIEANRNAWINKIEAYKTGGDLLIATIHMGDDKAKQLEALAAGVATLHSIAKVLDENYDLNDGYIEVGKTAALAVSMHNGPREQARVFFEGLKAAMSFNDTETGKRVVEWAGAYLECVPDIADVAKIGKNFEGFYQCASSVAELAAKGYVDAYNAGKLTIQLRRIQAYSAARKYLQAYYESGGNPAYMREIYKIDNSAKNYDPQSVGISPIDILKVRTYVAAVSSWMAEIDHAANSFANLFKLSYANMLDLKAVGIKNGGVVPVGTVIDFEATLNVPVSHTIHSINWMASGGSGDAPSLVVAGTHANVRFNSAGTYRVAAHAEVVLPDGKTYFMVGTFTVLVNDSFTASVTVSPIPVVEGNPVTIEIRTTPPVANRSLEIRFWNNHINASDLIGWENSVFVTDAHGVARGVYQVAKDCIAEGDDGDEIDRFSVYLQGDTRVLADGDLWIKDAACPPPPLELKATPGDGYVDLSWNAIPGATHYMLHMASGVTGPDGLPSIGTTTSTQYRVNGLQNGTMYRFTARAFKGNEVIVGSALVSATPVGNSLIAGRYQPIGDGSVVRDHVNRLEWKRCLEGQTWSVAGQRCDGVAQSYNWDAAIQLTAAGGFRIPNIEELKTLVYCSSGQPKQFGPLDACSGSYSWPTIVEAAFPNESSFVWSGSPYAGNSNRAWGVDFNNGNASDGPRYGYVHVRLVRAGQSSALLSTPIPAPQSVASTLATVPSVPPASLAAALAKVTGVGGTAPDAPLHAARLDAAAHAAFFLSRATNLLPGAQGGVQHLYGLDVASGALWRLSQAPSGEAADADTTAFDLAAQAGKLVFSTQAGNLEGGPGLYLLDLESGVRQPLRTAAQHGGSDPGAENPALGAAARGLAFDAPDAQGRRQVFTAGLDAAGLYDLRQETPLDAAAATACCAALSADGRYLAWQETGHDGRVQARVLDWASGTTATLDWPQGAAAAQALRLALSADGAQLHWLAAPVAAEDAAPLHRMANPLFVPTERLH